MTAKSIAVTMILAAGLAMGQTAPKKPVAPASQSATTPAAKPATTATKPAAKPATKAAAKTPAGKPDATATVAKTTSGAGKRDPFLSPVVGRLAEGGQGAPCATGKRCLVIDQLKLQGVVKTTGGWIAVIANPANKVYYLRVNDALFDGYVSRIEGDSIVFRQNVLDALGKQTQREVVKRVVPSA